MKLSHTKTHKLDLWWASLQHLVNWSAGASVASIHTKGCSNQLWTTITFFLAVFKAPTSCLETLYICMFLQLLSNSSSLQHVTKPQISASAHPAVPTEEALQVWDVIKKHPEVPTQGWLLREWEVSCTMHTVTPDSGFQPSRLQRKSSLTTPAMPSFHQDSSETYCLHLLSQI